MQGISAVDKVEGVVLENAGDLSIVMRPSGASPSSLSDTS